MTLSLEVRALLIQTLQKALAQGLITMGAAVRPVLMGPDLLVVEGA